MSIYSRFQTRHPGPRRRQRGLTLVELLVGMTVGLFLTAGVVGLFISTKESYRMTDAMSQVQENGRFAIEHLSRDLRQAGFKGTCIRSFNSLIDTTGAEYTNERFDLTTFFQGREGVDATTPGFDADDLTNYAPGTDAFFVKHAAEQLALTPVGATAAAATTITLNETTGDLENAILVVTDPLGCDIFQNRADAGTTSLSRKESDADGDAPGPGNEEPEPSLSHSYNDDMEIYRFRSRLYYIWSEDPEDLNAPRSLYRRVFDQGVPDEPGKPEDWELLEGVRDMQLTYGVDTNGDELLDSYVDADGVTDWGQVLAVKINLLLRSTDDNLVDRPMSLPFQDDDGDFFTAPDNDRHLYQVFTTTIGLRNRLP